MPRSMPGVLLSLHHSRSLTLPESLPECYSPGITPGVLLSRSHSRSVTLPESLPEGRAQYGTLLVLTVNGYGAPSADCPGSAL